MPNDLRSKMIRLAASMPKGSSERKALLNVLASGPDPSGRNWKKRSLSGIVHYLWEGAPDDDIKRITIIGEKPSLTRKPGDSHAHLYYMAVTMGDGSLYQQSAVTPDLRGLFLEGASLYLLRSDLRAMPGWKKI